MKSTKSAKKPVEVTYTINAELNKYKAPEFEPPKLKAIREKFKGKQIVIHR